MELSEADNDQSFHKDDIKYFSFYYRAIRRLLDIDNISNASYLYRYFKIFDEYFSDFCGLKPRDQHDGDFTMINLLKDCLYYRVVYIAKNSTFFSSAVAFHLRNALKDTPVYLRMLFQKQTLKICSLGGGPTSDIVAIVTVLESIAEKEGILLDFRITVIDSDKRWINTCITVLGCLKQFRKATWKINFIETDLTDCKTYTAETSKAIQDADIVTMVKFFTDLTSLKRRRQYTRAFEHISATLHPQAMLFVLDKSNPDFIKSCGGYSGEIDGFHLVYEELCDCHTLDINVVLNVFGQYQKNLGKIKCNNSGLVFARIWLKDSSIQIDNSKNKLKLRFQKNAEKYNPKEDFLNINSFRSWENTFSRQKKDDGWNRKGINKIVLKHNEKRNDMLKKVVEITKLLNTTREELVSESELLKDTAGFSSNEIDEDVWMKFWNLKQELSMLKRHIYNYSLFVLLQLKDCF
ncbi:uncharacterized protein NPIL_695341 [Nephila pilipes]|uniref:Uncharacterized protein n=1 Tax=Nephila pilipes TaxID=299642 RepID=A0A8X6U2X7_NEPPI|nr:uncharacterized protein NPIL_695341 [Nephila pilipes]